MERTHKEEEAKVAEKQQAEHLNFEKKRLDLDQEMLQQSNLQYERDQKERKKLAVCQALKQWDDRMDTEAYLENFEISMNEAEIPQNEWLPILRVKLTPGKGDAVPNGKGRHDGTNGSYGRQSYWLWKPHYQSVYPDDNPPRSAERIVQWLSLQILLRGSHPAGRKKYREVPLPDPGYLSTMALQG